MIPTLRRTWAAREHWAPAAAATLVVTVALAAALVAPLNHDEDQYVAAAVLARRLRPIVDFVYPQAPLQAWVLAPVVAVFPSAPLLAARLACALFGAVACLGAGVAVRGLGASRAWAAGAAVLAAASPVVGCLFETARNDALPSMLAIAGVLALLRCETSERPAGRTAWAGSGGLAMGLALCAKLTFVFAPAAAGLWLLARTVRLPGRWREIAAFSAGAAAGLAPAAALAWASPEAFVFDLVGLHRRLTPLWWARNGLSDRLAPDVHAAFWAAMLAQDAVAACALGVLAVAGWRVVRGGRDRHASFRGEAARPEGPSPTVLVALLAGSALVAAWLPSPSFTAYAAPPFLLLILLAAALGARFVGRARIVVVTVLAFAAALGLAAMGARVGAAAVAPQTVGLARLNRGGRELRAALRGAGPGAVITLAPSRALQAGRPIEPGLAAGSVVFREGDALSPTQARRLHALTPRTLDAALQPAPPAGVLVGFETEWPVDPEAPLVAWARAHGYVRRPLSEGEVWVRPAPPADGRRPQ